MLVDSFVDITSTTLRDSPREVLNGVTCVSLREDKPSVRIPLVILSLVASLTLAQINPDVLFTYLPQLEAFQKTTKPGSPERLHLGKLTEFLKTHYASISDKLTALVEHKEVTFDSLPVFFRPNSIIYMISPHSEKPRCLIFDSGQVQIENGQKYFDMSCRYLTHDGKCFGEATTKAKISEFHGVMKISSLGVFPLEYHPEKQKVVEQLTERGRKFLSLIGVHYRKYMGQGFYINKKEVRKFSVSGRVMVDAASFRERNPNYFFPHLDDKSSEGGIGLSIFDSGSEDDGSENGREVTKRKITCSADDLLVCSETVYAFCFQTKRWGQYMSFFTVPIHCVPWLILVTFR